jgi:hypothetical protein
MKSLFVFVQKKVPNFGSWKMSILRPAARPSCLPRGLLDFFRRGTEKPFPPANFAGDYVTSLSDLSSRNTLSAMRQNGILLRYHWYQYTDIYTSLIMLHCIKLLLFYSSIDIIGRLDIPSECTKHAAVSTWSGSPMRRVHQTALQAGGGMILAMGVLLATNWAELRDSDYPQVNSEIIRSQSVLSVLLYNFI